MITLSSRDNLAIGTVFTRESYVARVTTNPETPAPLRRNLVLRIPRPTGQQPDNFRLILVDEVGDAVERGWVNVVQIDKSLGYLTDGDIVKFDSSSLTIDVLFRRSANINSFLLTERCNSFCLMCSQPPRDVDDGYRADEILDAIPLIDRSTREIMFSGGEPTLLGSKFLALLQSAKVNLPNTAVHVLSNGRNFKDGKLARSVAEIGHRDLMIGIPIYSDVAWQHDFIVQADGAFDETVRGVMNLKRERVRVEIRVVIHKQNYSRLPKLAEWLGRNLLFVDQVALMGLEHTGFTKANMGALWIDPFDYQSELEAALRTLQRFGMRALVFNHQLCVLGQEGKQASVRSISDWKADYLPECLECDVKRDCGGFFSSTLSRHSQHIRPIRATA